jgi:hypothetical protein
VKKFVNALLTYLQNLQKHRSTPFAGFAGTQVARIQMFASLLTLLQVLQWHVFKKLSEEVSSE